MNRISLKPLVLAILAGSIASASAQTVLTTSGLIKTAGNWNNGLPSSSNLGTIAIGGTIDTSSAANALVTGFHFTVNSGGTLTTAGTGNNPNFDSSVVNINGGAFDFTGGNQRGLTLQNSSVFTLTSGSITLGATNGALLIASNSALTVNGGTLATTGANRGMGVGSGGTLTINGGTVTNLTGGTGTFGRGNNTNGNNVININGGTTTANLLTFGASSATISTTLRLGGSTVGSFTAANFNGTDAATERAIDLLSGTKITLRISGADEWAAAEWSANRLMFDGVTSTGLGGLSWADATNPSIGLGGGEYFTYDSGTETLALAAVPEPSTWFLLSIGLTIAIISRRRYQVL